MTTTHFKRLTCQIATAVSGLVFMASALADNCYSTVVVDVAVDQGGTLWVTTSSTPLHAVCNVSTKGPFTMDVNACNAALAVLISAKVSSRPVSVQYLTGTCASPGRYTAYYVQLN